MSRGYLPVIDPAFTDAVGPLEKLLARGMPVFHDNDNPRIEFLLGVINAG
jgi:hypothetical protein